MSENQDQDTRLVVLTRFYNPQDAHIARGYLENHDIPCHLFDEHNTMAWHLQIGVGGVRLMIPAYLHQEASTLLIENDLVKASEIKPLLPEDNEGLLKASLSLLISFLAGAPFLWKKRKTFEDTGDNP